MSGIRAQQEQRTSPGNVPVAATAAPYHQQIPRNIMYAVRSGRLSRAAGFDVFLALAEHADKNCWCFPSHRRLAELTGLSVRWVIKKLAELAAGGWIEIVTRIGTSNGYWILALDGVGGKSLPDEGAKTHPLPVKIDQKSQKNGVNGELMGNCNGEGKSTRSSSHPPASTSSHQVCTPVHPPLSEPDPLNKNHLTRESKENLSHKVSNLSFRMREKGVGDVIGNADQVERQIYAMLRMKYTLEQLETIITDQEDTESRDVYKIFQRFQKNHEPAGRRAETSAYNYAHDQEKKPPLGYIEAPADMSDEELYRRAYNNLPGHEKLLAKAPTLDETGHEFRTLDPMRQKMIKYARKHLELQKKSEKNGKKS